MSSRFELNFFMNPMGFGFGGMMPFSPCCSGIGSFMPSLFCGSNFMSMPYSDTLSFLNTPVVRNTTYDYLLNPNFAIAQCQQQWMQGRGFGGSTMLPGWEFPQTTWNPTPFPWMTQSPWAPKVETAEEKKTREEKAKTKAEEEKKSEHTKAKSLEKLFNEIKKISTDDNGLEAITKEQEDAVKEAMKKETAKERYDAMKEVFEGIEPSTIKKAILNNENIRKDLRKAGYNFDKSENSLKNPDIKEENCDHKKQVEKIYESIKNHKSAGFSDKYNELMKLAGTVADGNILSYISAWNDKYNSNNDKSVLRWIASNLPDSTEVTAMQEVIPKDIILITQGLLDKAKEYDEKGCTDVDKAAKELDKQLKEIFGNDLDKAKVTDFNNSFKQQINQLAEKFDRLYVALRIREAVKVRDNIAKKEEYSFLNEVKEGIINDNLIVAETIKDLKAEGFEDSQIPEVAKLPKPKKTSEEQAAARRESKKADKELDTAEEKLNHLVEQELLTPLVSEDDVTVDDNKIGVYKTAGLDDNGKDARYFKIIDDTIVEVTNNSEGKFEPVEEEADDSKVIEEITNYTQAINRAKDLIASGAIVDYRTSVTHSQYPIFKASGANQFFIIKDNQLYEIKNCTGINEQAQGDGKFAIHAVGTEKTLDKLTEVDLNAEFTDGDIKSTANNLKEQEKEEKEEIEAIEAFQFESLKDAKSYTKRLEISKLITKPENDNDETVVFTEVKDANGFFKSEHNGKTRYYKYDETTNKLVCLTEYITKKDIGGVISIKNGIAKIRSSKCIETVEIRENMLEEPLSENEKMEDKIQEYGLAFAKSVSGPDSGNDYPNALRKLNTLVATINSSQLSRNDKAEFVKNFIKGYQSNCHWYTAQDKGICKQIFEETGINEGKNIKDFNTKTRYISMIAKGILELAKVSDYDNEDDIELLKKVSNGNFIYTEEVSQTVANTSVVPYNTSYKSSYTYESLSVALAKKLDIIIDKIIERADK